MSAESFDYEKYWKLYLDRIINPESDSHLSSSNFSVQNAQQWGLCKSRSMLNIGPGLGERDKNLIESCLPDLDRYIGVDIDKDMQKICEGNVASVQGRNIKIESYSGTMQNYPGPSEPVDLILIEHVAYYILDFQDQLSRAYKWLNPGGHIVVSINNSVYKKNILKAIPEFLNVKNENPGTNGDDITRWLDALGYDYKVYDDKAYHLDISNPGDGGFLTVSVHNVPSPQQWEIAGEILKECAVPGTEKVPMCMTYFCVHKH